ncbi:MAG: hypothetical protein ACOYCE_00270 [Limnochordia bacterium]
MKKLSYLLAVIMVLSTATLAFGASLNIGGSLESSVEWTRDLEKEEEDETRDSFELSMDLTLDAGLIGSEGNMKAVIELASIELDRDDEKVLTPQIKRAYVETTGPFWLDGPEMTTTIGNLDLAYSPYIGRVKKDGVAVRGIEAGPVQLGGFLVWDEQVHEPAIEEEEPVTESFTVQGIQADANVQDIQLGATVIHLNRETRELAYALTGKMSPMEKVQLEAAYAGTYQDTDEDKYSNMFWAEAVMDSIENFTITTGIWAIDKEFEDRARYVDVEYEDDDETKDRIDWVGEHIDPAKDKAGLDLKVATEYEGFLLAAGTAVDIDRDNDYKMTRGKSTVSAEKEMVLDVANVKGGYELTINPYDAEADETTLAHKLSAEVRPTIMPVLEPLTLSGEVTFEGEETSYVAAAEYAAPNGITLGAEYKREYEDQEAERVLVREVTLDAGLKVEF